MHSLIPTTLVVLLVLMTTGSGPFGSSGVMAARKARPRKKGPLSRVACHKLPPASLCFGMISRVSFYTGESRVIERLGDDAHLKSASAQCLSRLTSMVCRMVYHRCDKLSGPKAKLERKRRLRKRQSKIRKGMCPRVKAVCKATLPRFPMSCRPKKKDRYFCCKNSRRRIIRWTYIRLNYDYVIKATVNRITNTGLMVFFALNIHKVYIELDKGIVVIPKYRPYAPENTNPPIGNMTFVNYEANGCLCPTVEVGTTYLIMGYYSQYKGHMLSDDSTVMKWSQKSVDKVLVSTSNGYSTLLARIMNHCKPPNTPPKCTKHLGKVY